MFPRAATLLFAPWLCGALLLGTFAGCRNQAPTSVTITLRVDKDVFRPEHVLITWRVPDGKERRDIRLPERDSFRSTGAILGSVSFELEASVETARELEVRGFRGDKRVSGARARVPFARSINQQLTLTLSCSEGIDDERSIAACSDPPPDAGVDVAPPSAPEPRPDAGVPTDTHAPIDLRADAADAAVADAAADARADVPDVAPGPDARDVAPEALDLRPTHPPVGVDLGAGLIAYFRFDDAPSLFPPDRSGNALNTRLVNLDPGGATVKGIYQYGLRFPASPAGFVRVTGDQLNEIGGPVTISAFVRIDRATDQRRTIVARRFVGPGGFVYSLHLNGDKPGLSLLSANGAHADVIGSRSVPHDTWVQVAMVYTVGTAYLYLDGRRVGEASFGLTLPPQNSPLTIGASDDGNPASAAASDPFVGDLDEIAVYNRALGENEVAALAAGFQPPLR